MTIAMSGVVWAMGYLVFGPGAVVFGVTFVFYVWIITVVVAMIGAILRARRTRIAYAAAPAATETAPAPASLAARLPAKLKNGTIFALQGEDHYVRVHTDLGSDLVLMRLADAIAEMGATPGARTHRSWWIAKSAVKSTRRTNGRVALVLANDIEVPVSRGYASELREAGWLTNGAGDEP
jgi:DNA-binding LytR/AlgR family response regulator